jgi:recombination protein RecA
MDNLDDILNDFQSKFGIKPKKPKELEVIQTGYKTIDTALGIGGIPIGKTTEISGEAGSGKTLLAYQLIAQAQKNGLIVLYIDTERNFSRDFAKKVGVNLEELVICTPVVGEMALQVIGYYAEHGYVDMVILDSLPALIATSELHTKLETAGNYEVQTRMLGLLLQYVMDFIEEKAITFVAINQIRTDVKTHKIITPFNKLMSYYASVRMQLSRVKSIRKNRKILGYKVEANIFKNNYSKRDIADFDLIIRGEQNG